MTTWSTLRFQAAIWRMASDEIPTDAAIDREDRMLWRDMADQLPDVAPKADALP